MPFIPHTKADIAAMLETIGVKKIEDLFDEIPPSLKDVSLEDLPEGVSEFALGKMMARRARQDADLLCFIGAGAYEHYIPACVWDLTARGEFMTAYTPYQAEASQGNLQLIYEYQTMIANLMAMEVANASLYDGATALSEAVLMTVRLAAKEKKNTVLIPKSVHPFYRDTVKAIVAQQGIQLVEVDYDKKTGTLLVSELEAKLTPDVAAIVIPQPNFFGVLEDVDLLTQWAQEKKIFSIGLVNPVAMALLKPPGQWAKGVDIACGEGQPLGIPLASGGPYYGFMCCRKAYIRQLPGRLVGRTVDARAREGFVLTLQAREQHIRRAKATSNICTNQGLMVTASTIYMSLMGPEGLRKVALKCHENTTKMLDMLLHIPGVERVFKAPFFHEIVLRMPYRVEPMLRVFAEDKIQVGYPLAELYPELTDCLLINVTETKTDAEIQALASHLQAPLRGNKIACQA